MPTRPSRSDAQPRPGRGPIIAGVVIAVLGVLAAVGITVAPPGSLPGEPDSGPQQLTQVPRDATECTTGDAIGGVSQSFSGSQVTSCGFAEAMRSAYGEQPVRGERVQITVNSPVSQQAYDMTCSGSAVVECTGGQNARIYLRIAG